MDSSQGQYRNPDDIFQLLDGFDFDTAFDEFLDILPAIGNFNNKLDNNSLNNDAQIRENIINSQPIAQIETNPKSNIITNEVTLSDTSRVGESTNGPSFHHGKHKRDELISYLNGNDWDDMLSSFSDLGDKEMLKVMRMGSLDRIIASTVVARRSSSDVLIPNQLSLQTIDEEENMKKVTDRFLKSLKNSDMHGLATVISEVCADSVFLTTPDLTEPAHKKSRIMMYFALIFESYPDGIWKVQSPSLNKNIVTIQYTFSGTHVFDQSLNTLFKYINQHFMKKIDDANIESLDQADCDFVVKRMSEYLRLSDSIPSPVINESHAIVSPPIPTHVTPVDDSDCISAKKTVTMNKLNPVQISCNESKSMNGLNVTLRGTDDNVIRVNSFSKVSVNSVLLTRMNSGNSFESGAKRLSFKEESATSSDPKIREIANKAIKQGPIKQQRRMDLAFNEIGQIIRITIA